MLRQMQKHDLVVTFRALKGNSKWSLLTEPLWFIPYALFVPYQSLFMREIGLDSLDIGFVISLGFVLQVVCALIGGIVTDKMGRRKATVIFDTIAWSIPCLIWAFSQNFWWFLVAACVNSCMQITNVSWFCFAVEDTPPKYLSNMFMLFQICGMLSVFVSPLAVWLVGKHGVVPVMRVIYLLSAVSMTAKFYLLYRFGEETQIGRHRLEETASLSFWEMLKGYKGVLLRILHSKKMLLVLFFMALSNISTIATTNYFSLYITEKLLLPKELAAVFPMIRTVVMIFFAIGLQNLINRLRMKASILFGLLFYIISHLVLLFAPIQRLPLVILYTALEAAAYAIVFPRKDALMTLYVDTKERSRIFALYNTGMIALSIPFGGIIGWLYASNFSYPFWFNILVFALTALLIFFSRDLTHYEEQVES